MAALLNHLSDYLKNAQKTDKGTLATPTVKPYSPPLERIRPTLLTAPASQRKTLLGSS